MVGLSCRKLQGCLYVLSFQIRKVRQYLLVRNAGSQEIQDILDTNSHTANAGASAALLGIYRDTFESGHFWMGSTSEKAQALILLGCFYCSSLHPRCQFGFFTTDPLSILYRQP